MQQTPCYVAADFGAEQAVFHEFLTPTQAPSAGSASSVSGSATGSTAAAASVGGNSGGRGKSGAGRGGNVPGLSADVRDGEGQAKALGPIGIPIYFPKRIKTGSNYCSSNTSLCPVETASPNSYPRAYLLHDRSGVAHYAYRMTLELNPVLGQYYGVQGTTWQNPPILNSPTTTQSVGGKQLLLYANGSKLSLVAWRTSQGVYWISNTLSDDLGNQQMVAIAASLTQVGGK